MNPRDLGWKMRPRRRAADGIDASFRLGVALFATWVYLRTLVIVAPGIDLVAWEIFAWWGGFSLALVWLGAVGTWISWMHDVRR